MQDCSLIARISDTFGHPDSMRTAVAWTIWQLLLLLCLVPPLESKGVELSSSVVLFYNSEFQPMYGSSVSQCELLLRRAHKHGSRSIQFVPTHYWYDANDASQNPETCYPDNWADTDLKVDYYCSKFEWNSKCEPFNATSTSQFSSGMKQCLMLAVQLFDDVIIAPHLDPAVSNSKRAKWRNMLRFDPLEKDKYGYSSYWDLMLQPLLQAASKAFGTSSGKTLYFAMGGEMGGTLLNQPASYLKIYNLIRSGWKSSSRLKLGVTFYHAYTPGQLIHGPGKVAPIPASPLGLCDGGYGPLLPFDKWPGVGRLRAVLPDTKKLLQASEFVGVSNYARAPSDVQPSHMESSTAKLLAELKAMGIDLAPQFKSGSKQFIWNEFALGGGISSCGDTPGTSASIGLFPWLGITSNYDPKLDPFKQSPKTKAYLKQYYAAALKVLAAGGLQYPVNGAYIWNVGSWDVQGIHTSSAVWNTSVEQGDWPVRQGFADAEVIKMIQQHNNKVNSQ